MVLRLVFTECLVDDCLLVVVDVVAGSGSNYTPNGVELY